MQEGQDLVEGEHLGLKKKMMMMKEWWRKEELKEMKMKEMKMKEMKMKEMLKVVLKLVWKGDSMSLGQGEGQQES